MRWVGVTDTTGRVVWINAQNVAYVQDFQTYRAIHFVGEGLPPRHCDGTADSEAWREDGRRSPASARVRKRILLGENRQRRQDGAGADEAVRGTPRRGIAWSLR